MRRWPAPSRSAMPPSLSQRIGRKPTDGELYMAHFFGTGGAGQLINAAKDRPQANAAGDISGGGARQQIDLLRPAGQCPQRRRRLFRAQPPLSGGARQCDAGRRADGGRSQHARRRPQTPAAPDTAGTTQAFAAAAPRPVVAAAEPAFRSLFHEPTGRGAVSPIVSELWTHASRVAGIRCLTALRP